MTDTIAGTDISLTMKRTLAAPRDLVFRAWTEPEMLSRWWGAGPGFSTPIAEVDLRVGGKYRLGMQAPDQEHPYVVVGTYREVRPPERLVYTWAWEQHESGNAGEGAPDFGSGETLVTVEFHEAGGKTELVVTHELFPDRNMRDEHNQGWEGVLTQLAGLMEESSV
jgi:uncharacterized protein YndB with AHSA1/START domain